MMLSFKSQRRVCENSIVMFNQKEEEMHAKTLTNLGTVKKVCVCELMCYNSIINLGVKNEF
jgi:hypothetical protein